MKTDRLVIDTNVVISGFLAPTSIPGRALDHAIESAHVIGTDETMGELIGRLMSATFDRWLSAARRQATLDRLVPLVEIVAVVRLIRVCRDPMDTRFLEAAINGSADVLVTGDTDLLVSHPFMDVAIITPADYLTRVKTVD
jgi:putative PIN family toxin of toxin-antitoxin system